VTASSASVARETSLSGEEAEGRVPAPRPGLVLALLCAAQCLVVLDGSIVNVALPTLERELGFTNAGLQWVVSAYALAFGGLLLLGGRVADLAGRRRVFVAAVVAFVAASLAGGLAPSAGALVAARAAQGAAAAFVAPAVLSLITTTFAEGEARNRALAVFGAVAAGGFALGLLLGGVLTSALGWRWVFFVNVPIGAAVVLAAPRLLADGRGARNEASLDVAGAATVTLGLAALVLGVSRAEGAGWGSAATLLTLGVAGVLLAAFVAVERRAAAPLVPGALVRRRPVLVANAVAVLFGAALSPMLYVLTLYLQRVRGLSPAATGLAFLPHALAVAASAGPVARLTTRVGVRPSLVGGGVVVAGGLALLSRVTATSSVVWLIVPGTVLAGIGVAALIVGAAVAATAGVPDEEQGVASGLFNTAQQVGGAVGLAALVAVSSTVAAGAAAPGAAVGAAPALLAGFRVALATAAGLGGAAAVLALAVGGRPGTPP
jgi:EmrB/QacA subfamily drug resistance transporter